MVARGNVLAVSVLGTVEVPDTTKVAAGIKTDRGAEKERRKLPMKLRDANLPEVLVRAAKLRGDGGVDYRGYVECMDEIKRRISDIDFALQVPRNPATQGNLERLALNFRKTLELMIMACQAAHSGQIGKKVKEWRIKNIERLLLKYNNDFFMHPVDAQADNIEDKHDVDVLTLPELKIAHGKCAAWLHANGPYSSAIEPLATIAEYTCLRGKIVRLLNAHRVRISDELSLYCCMNAAGSGKTHVSIFSRVGAADLLTSANAQAHPAV